MRQLEAVIDLLDAAAVETGRLTRQWVYHARRRRNRILRAGPDTPLWNELAKAVAPYLRRRGEKAQLGRVLGLPRQRIHQILVARTAFPDAERTLLLVAWVAAQRRNAGSATRARREDGGGGRPHLR